MAKTLQDHSGVPWRKGACTLTARAGARFARGEWYLVAQALLAVLVLLGPRTCAGWPAWVHPYAEIAAMAGVALALAGGLLFAAAVLRLGPNFTPVPFPKAEGTLVETGPYGFVRHPMYSGVVLLALGWALWVHGWLTIGYVLILFLFVDVKSRQEEKWLVEKFSGYQSYRRRVRKLIPYIY